jgi:hypothetical protein
MPPAVLAPVAIQQFFDANGNPLAGGLLSSFLAGTSTPSPIYSDAGLSIPLSNPVVLDAAGRPASGGAPTELWLDSALAYKQILADSGGVTVWTADNLTAGGAANKNPIVSGGAAASGGSNVVLTVPTAPIVAVELTNPTLLTIAGFTGGAPGQILQVKALGNGQVDLLHLNGAAAAGDQLNNISATTLSLLGGSATYVRGSGGNWNLLQWTYGTAGSPIVGSAATGAVTTLAVPASPITSLELTNAALMTLHGVTGGVAGQLLIVRARGAGQVDLVHNSGSMAAGDRFQNLATSAPSSLLGGYAIYQRNSGGGWNMIGHDQGSYIVPAYSGANFSGNGAMTWTVEAGDVSIRYLLRAKQLHVVFQIATTSVGGTPNIALQIGNGNFGGFLLPTQPVYNSLAYLNDAGTITQGYTTINGSTFFSCIKQTAANFTATTNTTYAYGQTTCEVT